ALADGLLEARVFRFRHSYPRSVPDAPEEAETVPLPVWRRIAAPHPSSAACFRVPPGRFGFLLLQVASFLLVPNHRLLCRLFPAIGLVYTGIVASSAIYRRLVAGKYG